MGENSEKPPELFDQCLITYQLMDEKANDQGLYVGMLTTDMSSIGFGTGLYTKITRTLISMGCIARHRRGAREQPSIWKLLMPPTEETFALRKAPQPMEHKTKIAKQADQMYTDFNRRLLAIEIEIERQRLAINKLVKQELDKLEYVKRVDSIEEEIEDEVEDEEILELD